MDAYKFLNKINSIIYYAFVIFFLGVGIAVVVDNVFSSCKRDVISSPVEELHDIDSLQISNDKLIIEVNNLDSIKNVKVIEVKALDNDSTLKLFYQLISK